ncbi:MAG: tRNA/rRNA methyltransferase SpoU [Bryobacteraceae bacterium]|nr:MAG: tRNA/rRNA methyltransferase SpoU [Bryobacteraceae bacterium]
MSRASAIQSPHNPLLKEIRRALARDGLTRAGLCVAEGFHLLEEALRSGLRVETVLATEAAAAQALALIGREAKVRVAIAGERVFAAVSATEQAQGVLALAEPPRWREEELFARPGPVVVLDRLQDPGNAGAIARAAEAFGAAGLVWVKGTVARWNPKTLRASAGSLFRLPVIDAEDAASALALFARRAFAVRTAVPRDGVPLWEADWRVPCALVIGNEAHGAGEEWMRAGEPVRIPTAGVESLNAAAAAAVILYEAMRQREAP